MTLPQASDPAVVPLVDGLAGRVQPGPGSRVLWIHGYTLDSRSWREMWRRLPGWHHVGLDLPAHGGSAPIGDEDDLRVLARRVGEYCVREDIRHLVALSFGTVMATQIALELPDHFASLVLGAPSLAGGPTDMDVAAAYSQLFELHMRGASAREMQEAWMRCIAWRGIERQPALREELGALVLGHAWTELAGWKILRLFNPPQPEQELRAIRAPLLVVIGEHDLPAFHACADILERNVPRCRRVTLADTHHLCMLESPDASAGPIQEHLRAHDHAARPRAADAGAGAR